MPFLLVSEEVVLKMTRRENLVTQVMMTRKKRRRIRRREMNQKQMKIYWLWMEATQIVPLM